MYQTVSTIFTELLCLRLTAGTPLGELRKRRGAEGWRSPRPFFYTLAWLCFAPGHRVGLSADV